MEKKDRAVKFDGELEALWKEGLTNDKAEQYLNALEKAGECEAGLVLRSKILDATIKTPGKTRFVRLIPVLAPALLLLWMAVSAQRRSTLPATELLTVENEYLEIATLMDEFVGDEVLDDELDASSMFFSVR